MNYVVTGASGFIGQALVPKLKDMPNTNVAVVGRDINKLNKLFPTLLCFDYSQSEVVFEKIDVVIHLAVANNVQGMGQEDLHNANVVLLENVLKNCSDNGVSKFVYTSSTHVTSKRSDPYTDSKREAEALINRYAEILPVVVLRLPAVFSENSKGKQKILNYLPKFLQYPTVRLLGLLIPVKALDEVCDMIIVETLS